MRGPPILGMRWHDLLFMHWPVPVAGLRPLVPPELSIDTFDGSAWLGVVPFRMTRVRPLRVPLPGERFAFAEINVRTYVTLDGRPGVWFFSLDGGDRLNAAAARIGFGVPYHHADVRATEAGGQTDFRSQREGPPRAELGATYRPIGRTWHAPAGSLDDFLTNRLCLYAATRPGRIRRVDIEHEPWPLQDAIADVEVNTMASSHGIGLPGIAPRLAFARRLDVVAWRPVRVR